MAYEMKTVAVGTDWTLITDKVALLQFNDEIEMALTSGLTPTDTIGITMDAKEKYINSAAGVSVWAKAKRGGTGVESVRVAENVI
jgi:hypothetical protein